MAAVFEDPEPDLLVGAALDVVASAGRVTTIVLPGDELVTTVGVADVVGDDVLEEVDDDDDEEEVSPPNEGTLDSSPVSHTVIEVGATTACIAVISIGNEVSRQIHSIRTVFFRPALTRCVATDESETLVFAAGSSVPHQHKISLRESEHWQIRILALASDSKPEL